MSNYTKSTNFAAKDSLPSGNAGKVVKGTEINTEFDNIATAIATKADLNSPTLVTPNLGTPSAAVLTNATGLPLTTGVTGTLPVANGGTGATTFSAGALLKGAGTSAITTATAGTDYAPATSGTAILKGNGTGGFSNAAAGTDYAAATTGTSAQLLANNGSGGFSNVTVGSGLSLSAGTLSNTASVSAATPTTLGTVYGSMNTSSLAFLGYNAGLNTTGTQNTGVGFEALRANTTGQYSTAVGYQALAALNGAGAQNTAVGRTALTSMTTGSENTAVGVNALYTATTAGTCVAVGDTALFANTTGSNNTGIGYRALYTNSTANNSTAVGYQALYNSTGADNTSLGYQAGDVITTGTGNVIIGKGADPSVNSATDQIVIGNGVTGQANTNVTIGNGTGKIYNAYTVNATWTQTSDGTMKNVIGPDSLGLSFINRLNPILFTWKAQNDLPPDHPYYAEENKRDTTRVIHGFVAQEVKAALDAEGCSTFNGWDQGDDGIQAISREMFISPLVKAVQELSAQVQALQAEIATLKGA